MAGVSLTDADLVARVLLNDDHHAFSELVRRHQSAVRGLLRQLTRTDAALADDLAQETFLKAFKNIRSFRGEAKFSTWLYRIAYNCFREEARKRKELVGIDETQLEAEQDPNTVDPALRQDLMQALRLLPLHERTRRPALLPERPYLTMKLHACSTFRSERLRPMCCAGAKS